MIFRVQKHFFRQKTVDTAHNWLPYRLAIHACFAICARFPQRMEGPPPGAFQKSGPVQFLWPTPPREQRRRACIGGSRAASSSGMPAFSALLRRRRRYSLRHYP